MTVQCITCTHADLRCNPAMSRAGLAVCCMSRRAGKFCSLTFDRECRRFVTAEADSITKRRAWLAKKGGKA